MSPIDDELRRVLAAHADDAALQTDPLAGIEREAKSLRRRRTGTAVLGAALSVAVVALAVPSIRTSLDADSANKRFASTPTPSVSDDAIPRPTQTPPNAFPWHRSVTPADYAAALRAWGEQNHYGDTVEGQPLWEGAAVGLAGRVVVFQAWFAGDSDGADAHTVTALVGGPYVDTVIVGDEVSYFSEQQPGEPASATKYDVQRGTHVIASYVLADHTAKTVLVVRPDIAGAMVDEVPADVSSGGVIVDRHETPRTVHVVLTDDKGNTVADRQREPAVGSVLTDSPLRWTRTDLSFMTSTNDPGDMADEAAAEAALRAAVPSLADIVAGNTAYGSLTSGSVQMVVGEYADHGWGATDAAYVAGFYLAEKGKPAQLIGLHDLPLGITSISGLIPATFYKGQQRVFFIAATGWHVRYVGQESAGWVSLGLDPVGNGPQEVESTPVKSEGDPVLRDGVGRGLSFPDI